MPTPDPQLPKPVWWRRKWVTVGEVVAIAALAIAVLGYLDTQRQRHTEDAQRVAAARVEAKREALLLTATASDDGARLAIAALKPGQAIQSQRYLFPHTVLDHAMEVSAAQPQIDGAWVEGGLRRAATDAGAKAGEGELPVGIVTTYLEDGEARSDASIYRIGYRLGPGGLFGAAKVRLQGLALGQRAVKGDLQTAVEARWGASAKLR